ncbi:MAG: hypothetical protein V1921_06755 [Candidatus Altiarchaeota archaeon]
MKLNSKSLMFYAKLGFRVFIATFFASYILYLLGFDPYYGGIAGILVGIPYLIKSLNNKLKREEEHRQSKSEGEKSWSIRFRLILLVAVGASAGIILFYYLGIKPAYGGVVGVLVMVVYLRKIYDREPEYKLRENMNGVVAAVIFLLIITILALMIQPQQNSGDLLLSFKMENNTALSGRVYVDNTYVGNASDGILAINRDLIRKDTVINLTWDYKGQEWTMPFRITHNPSRDTRIINLVFTQNKS